MRHILGLSPGSRLGPYTIVSALGAGGMGEVYRARDTRLDRDVAIKILPDVFSKDAERLTRFEREAKTLASLNHPHIAHVHGLEESGGMRALVMELVEGEDLSARIARGPIPLDEALPIARQIADALDAAHERGIIHRDLKPANVKVREDGAVKVLDFGLAKAMEKGSAAGDAINSPTFTSPATEMGVILGTAAYMSPEQAKGRPVDRRADVWAFGVVLFEMLGGRRAFSGDDISDVLASVLKDAPALDALPAGTPVAVRRLLRRCLEKDRAKRLDSMADVRLEIDEALSVPGFDAPAAAASPAKPAPLWLRLAPWVIAAGAVAVAGASIATRRGAPPPSAPLYAALDAPAGYVLGEDDALTSLPTRTPFVFTPDGRSLIIQASRGGKTQLFLRQLDQPDARPVPGTEGALSPFVSPDGKWVGFWADNELRKAPLDGGVASTICALTATLGPNGASWGSNGVIVFADDRLTRLMRVAASGGTPEAVTTAESVYERRHVTPFILPDGKRVLYADVSTLDVNDTRLMVQGLDGGDRKVVVERATDGRLLPTGDLAFMRLGTLMVAPFDAARGETTGPPIGVLSGVMQSGLRGRFGATHTGAGMYAVSSLGTLLAIRGEVTGTDPSPLSWVTSSGATAAEPAAGAPPGGRLWAQLSPDGSRAAVRIATPVRYELWIADWTRKLWTRCADCPTGIGAAVWSPDGRRLLLSKNDTLTARTLDGSAPDQTLVREDGRLLAPADWVHDGSIVYSSTSEATTFEIKVLAPGGSAGSVILAMGVGTDPDVSPDGKWIAYTSTQTGTREVFVQAFPHPGSRTQVSAGGGRNPAWSRDGRTVFYLDNPQPGRGGSTVLAVDVITAAGVKPGSPREILRHPDGQGCFFVRCYDVSADGRRFLLRDRQVAARKSVSRMDLMVNWTTTLPTSGPR